jgi:acyl-coenzyme A synthetase/AMP-(fatty) acid ligase
MPQPVLKTLQKHLPNTDIFLMYGLTEAFRSTYLEPTELAKRPNSIGKAIPQAEIKVLRADGSSCAPGEPGELVHSGPLVAKGYWNNPQATDERFRLLPEGEKAVWSGDTVSMDEEGFLYFLARRDDQIKTSGYRVSPTEVEEVLYASGLVREAAVVGIPDPMLGQAIIAFVESAGGSSANLTEELTRYCQKALPAYMVPSHISVIQALPKTAHGKIDRRRLAQEMTEQAQARAS